MALLPGRTPRASEIISGCDHCGKWMRSPWEGRYAEDVGIEPVAAYMEAITGHPHQGVLLPAPRRPGGMRYTHGAEDEPYSGSICEDCAAKQHEEHQERIERLQAAMREPAKPAEEEAPKSEPTKEEGETT